MVDVKQSRDSQLPVGLTHAEEVKALYTGKSADTVTQKVPSHAAQRTPLDINKDFDFLVLPKEHIHDDSQLRGDLSPSDQMRNQDSYPVKLIAEASVDHENE